MNEARRPALGPAVFWGAIVLAVLPFVVLGWFSIPGGDDYRFAVVVRERGWWDSLRHWYLNWSGRYSTCALLSAVTGTADPAAACRWIAPVAVLAQLGALALLVRAATRRRVSWTASGGAALVLLALQTSGLHLPKESYYSIAASVCYPWGSVAAMLLLALLLGAPERATGTATAVRVGLGAFLAVLAAGFNEGLLAMVTVALVAGTAAQFAGRRPGRRLWLVLLLVWAAAAAVSLLSPGSRVRMEHPWFVDRNRRFGWSLLQTLSALAGLGLEWSLSPAVLAAGLLLAHAVALRAAPAARDPGRHRLPLLLLAAALATGIFPSFWALGAPPDARVADQARLVFLLGGAAWIGRWSAARGRAAGLDRLPAPVLRTARIVLVLALLLRGNVGLAWRDLAGSAQDYRSQWESRWEQLAGAAALGVREAVVAPIDAHPTIIELPDLAEGAPGGGDPVLARFYGLDKVRIAP